MVFELLAIIAFIWVGVVSLMLLTRLKELDKDDPSTVFNWGINFWINIFENKYKEDHRFNSLVWQARISVVLLIISLILPSGF